MTIFEWISGTNKNGKSDSESFTDMDILEQ